MEGLMDFCSMFGYEVEVEVPSEKNGPTSPSEDSPHDTVIPGGIDCDNMKDVIDVMQLQREKSKQIPTIDYREVENNFIAIRFIFECGIKLDAEPLTIATAAILYHRFFKEADNSGYDSYLVGGKTPLATGWNPEKEDLTQVSLSLVTSLLNSLHVNWKKPHKLIAATTLYLAGKVKDDPLKIRDVINVTHNTLNRGSAPLELGDEYWNMRDAIVQAELLIMRMLKFEVTLIHPHKYLLHYLKSLEGWCEKEEWAKMPIAKAASGFLQDFHYDPAIIDYSPQHIAVACINLALQCYGGQVLFTDEGEGVAWYSVFAEDLQRDKLWEIMEKIMEVYNKEPN